MRNGSFLIPKSHLKLRGGYFLCVFETLHLNWKKERMKYRKERKKERSKEGEKGEEEREREKERRNERKRGRKTQNHFSRVYCSLPNYSVYSITLPFKSGETREVRVYIVKRSKNPLHYNYKWIKVTVCYDLSMHTCTYKVNSKLGEMKACIIWKISSCFSYIMTLVYSMGLLVMIMNERD